MQFLLAVRVFTACNSYYMSAVIVETDSACDKQAPVAVRIVLVRHFFQVSTTAGVGLLFLFVRVGVVFALNLTWHNNDLIRFCITTYSMISNYVLPDTLLLIIPIIGVPARQCMFSC